MKGNVQPMGDGPMSGLPLEACGRGAATGRVATGAAKKRRTLATTLNCILNWRESFMKRCSSAYTSFSPQKAEYGIDKDI